MRSILFVLFITAVACGTFAQSQLKFAETQFDFGEIYEVNGPVEHTFFFVNKSSKPIKIVQVKASCGCTTPGWTREEVAPGDSGYVKAKYNPYNRPGKFRKTLRITTNDPASNQTLYINGFVKQKPKSPEEIYGVRAGNLRFKTKTLNLGKITTEKVVSKLFDVYNGADDYAWLDERSMRLPAHIQVKLVGDSLRSREVGQVEISYDPIKKADFGYISDQIVIDTTQEGGLSVTAVIEEYFPEMSAEELDGSPRLEIADRSYQFGKIVAGTPVTTTFELSNAGKKKLLFRTIKSNCDCLTYTIKSNAIKKGKSQTLEVFLDTSKLRGNQYKSLTVYSNDPVAPTQIISIRGTVEKK